MERTVDTQSQLEGSSGTDGRNESVNPDYRTRDWGAGMAQWLERSPLA